LSFGEGYDISRAPEQITNFERTHAAEPFAQAGQNTRPATPKGHFENSQHPGA
jgi:hypothetical protein